MRLRMIIIRMLTKFNEEFDSEVQQGFVLAIALMTLAFFIILSAIGAL